MVQQQVAVTRGLLYASRFARQQADQSIKRDVPRAIVELVLNSDDSYRRLEASGRAPSGEIDIFVERKRSGSVIRVVDYAEGMDGQRMDKGVGSYGEDMAGPNVRGFFGRGLKDAIIGLGKGEVTSTRNGRACRCTLEVESGGPKYTRYRDAPRAEPNGALVTVVVDRPDVSMPQIEPLHHQLEQYFSLREVMLNPRRNVTLHEVGGRSRKWRLSFSTPVGKELLQEGLEVPGYPGTVTLEVYRSEVPLASPAEEGPTAPGGLLFTCRRGILALSLLKYAHDPNAEHLFGRVSVPHLDDLLDRQEPVLVATREVEGLDWNHPYNRALKSILEDKLRPLVEAEAKRRQSAESHVRDQRLRAAITSALDELNMIAQGELAGEIGGVQPSMPPRGFGFVPEYVQVVAGKDAALYIRTLTPTVVPCGADVHTSSDNNDVVVKTPLVKVEEDGRHEELGRAKIIVEGRRIGAEALMTAKWGQLEACALVKVISKRLPPVHTVRKGRQGLIKDIRFRDLEPRIRSSFEDGVIIIEVGAPTVSPYIGPGGKGAYDTGHGQVMLAELIADAFCREVARERVGTGLVPSPIGGQADAREREYRRLHNQYAGRIHELFVEGKYRGIAGSTNGHRGRPRSEEMMDRAAAPL
jgi:hypothetical protein